MQAWQAFLNSQEKKLGKDVVDKWLRPLKIAHFDSANLYLEVEDSFQMLWFEEHIRPDIKIGLFNNNHRPIKVHLTVTGNPLTSTKKEKKETLPAAIPPLVLTPDSIDSKFDLAHFIPGAANEIFFRFLCELASFDPIEKTLKNPSITKGTCNPIYIYGGAASGKTHLLHALTTLFKKQGLLALYVRADTFTEHVVSAIRNSQMQTFRKSYRTADVLLVDDIHLLARRAATQEEFFHTFNTLHTDGKQIIITANCAPSLLQEIEPRLISRFEWGIAFHLERLSEAELLQVLKNRCETLELSVTDDVLPFLVETFPPHSKSLHRALDTLILRTHLEKADNTLPLDLKTTKSYLKNLIEAERAGALTPEKIISIVSTFHGMCSEDILGKSHTQECVLPRHVAIYLCRKELKLPFTQIGRIFLRDHSTIMTSVKIIETKLEDKEFFQTLQKIQQQIELAAV